jgi:hypothetical protein
VIDTNPHHSQLQVILYVRLQVCGALSRAISFCNFIEREIQWVDDLVVCYPVLSPLDRRAINDLNRACLCVIQGSRTMDRPKLFSIPHCTIYLYENVLEANWMHVNKNMITILGNNLNFYMSVSLDCCVSKKKLRPFETMIMYCIKCHYHKQILEKLVLFLLVATHSFPYFIIQ